MSMCNVISCVVEKGCFLWPVQSFCRILLVFALLHFVLQGQTFLLLQESLNFLLLHSYTLWWIRHLFFCVLVLRSFLFLIILFYFFLLYNIVLVLPYINMHLPWVYMCSPSWTPLPSPSPYHPSGSSQCTSPKLPVSCIEPRLAIRFYKVLYMF